MHVLKISNSMDFVQTDPREPDVLPCLSQQLWADPKLLSVCGNTSENQPAQVPLLLEPLGSQLHGLLRVQRDHGGKRGVIPNWAGLGSQTWAGDPWSWLHLHFPEPKPSSVWFLGVASRGREEERQAPQPQVPHFGL